MITEEKLIQIVLSKMRGNEKTILAAKANDLEHFNYVGCEEAEHLISNEIDIDQDLEWFNSYLMTPPPVKRKDLGDTIRAARQNPLNLKISKLFWESQR